MSIAKFLSEIGEKCNKTGNCACLYATKVEVFLCDPQTSVIGVTLKPGREVCTSALNNTKSLGTHCCPELHPGLPPSEFPDYCIRRRTPTAEQTEIPRVTGGHSYYV